MATESHFRVALVEYIRSQARPVEKFSHQLRLYAVATEVGQGKSYDDDVLFAAAWVHDLGVFYGHRPEDPDALARWDNTLYAIQKAPAILKDAGFPPEKVPAVLEAVRTHQPAFEPATTEGVILRDADILEQLGAIGILRTVCKIGRDTRFETFAPAVESLRRALTYLPGQIRLEATRKLAAPRIEILSAFLKAVDSESQGIL